jgi:hypothetical protein
MLLDAGGVAHGQGGGVDEADAGALPPVEMQVHSQRHEEAGHEIDKACVADELRELLTPVDVDVLEVEPFEGAVP